MARFPSFESPRELESCQINLIKSTQYPYSVDIDHCPEYSEKPVKSIDMNHLELDSSLKIIYNNQTSSRVKLIDNALDLLTVYIHDIVESQFRIILASCQNVLTGSTYLNPICRCSSSQEPSV